MEKIGSVNQYAVLFDNKSGTVKIIGLGITIVNVTTVADAIEVCRRNLTGFTAY